MDPPFAVRGVLISTGSKYHTKDGFQRSPPSLEQLKHKSGSRVPYYGSSFLSRASHGSRALHGTQGLSEASKGAFANRPLSPHLALKKPQLSATYSISHRIFGGVVAGGIMLVPIAYKFSTLYDI